MPSKNVVWSVHDVDSDGFPPWRPVMYDPQSIAVQLLFSTGELPNPENALSELGSRGRCEAAGGLTTDASARKCASRLLFCVCVGGMGQGMVRAHLRSRGALTARGV